MSVSTGSYLWSNVFPNSIIQDFDPDTNGNQTVNNNFSLISGTGGLSENGIIYGFNIGSVALSIEGIKLGFNPSNKYGLSLQIFAISGTDIGKSVIINKPAITKTIDAPEVEFNDVRILVTLFDLVTGVPIDAVTRYQVVLRTIF